MSYFPNVRKLGDIVLNQIYKRPFLNKIFGEMATKYEDMMGFRKLGLFKVDIIDDEHPVVKIALSRLSDKEMFERNFRIRRAIQLDMLKEVLPVHERPVRHKRESYLLPLIFQVADELDEKAKYNKREK